MAVWTARSAVSMSAMSPATATASPPVGDDLVDDGLDLGGVHAGAAFDVEAGVAGDDRGALFGEDFADLRSHAAGAAGDQRHLAVEVSHVIPNS